METKIELTQECVKQIFDYKDGVLYWKIKSSNNSNIGEVAGYYSATNNRWSIEYKYKSYPRANIIMGIYPKLLTIKI